MNSQMQGQSTPTMSGDKQLDTDEVDLGAKKPVAQGNMEGEQDPDSRDQLFMDDSEQTYSSPSASILSPPLENTPETKASRIENEKKTELIRPLGTGVIPPMPAPAPAPAPTQPPPQ